MATPYFSFHKKRKVSAPGRMKRPAKGQSKGVLQQGESPIRQHKRMAGA